MTIQSKSDLRACAPSAGSSRSRCVRCAKPCVPGMTTEQLDDVGAKFLRRHGARSAPQLTYDFPGFNCISVNDEVVHGVPGPRVLRAGDVVKIDVTAELDGYIADSAITVVIPPVHDAREQPRAVRARGVQEGDEGRRRGRARRGARSRRRDRSASGGDTR